MSAWAALAGPLFVVTTALLDPFAFFQPTVQLRPDDRAAMDDARCAVERRLRAEAVDVLESLRERLESGEPPRRSTE